MASQRTKRAVRAGLSVTAAAALLTFVPGPALALPLAYQQPPPPETASEALAQYKKLSDQVSDVNEDLLAAKTDLDKKNAAHRKANQDLAAAKKAQAQAMADQEAFRGKVDNLTNASFQGARFNKLSALLTGSSADDFLERASALGVLAADNEEALAKFSAAVNQADAAQAKAAGAKKRAADAAAAAKKLVDKVTKTKNTLEDQIEEVEEAYQELSGAEQQTLMGEEDNSVYLAVGPGLGPAAAEAAMSQRGDMYVWGAAGPDTYDCSGLTMWAYNQVGISLPHSSRAQFGYGKSVAYGEWKAGDLLFYGSSASSIHHVAMYVGDGMLVHASQSGTPVKTGAAPDGGGSDYLGAKRIVG
ncbi:NlpC/P60 family protein [Actinophytocola sp. NPDC049390]|uniref:NlpC/P60 family protein n=1 Tax=Actinophytocola sp. NPDC049390 TaxID=3363894 RepID=UPI0037A575F5